MILNTVELAREVKPGHRTFLERYVMELALSRGGKSKATESWAHSTNIPEYISIKCMYALQKFLGTSNVQFLLIIINDLNSVPRESCTWFDSEKYGSRFPSYPISWLHGTNWHIFQIGISDLDCFSGREIAKTLIKKRRRSISMWLEVL